MIASEKAGKLHMIFDFLALFKRDQEISARNQALESNNMN